jgi:hypothetical protein
MAPSFGLTPYRGIFLHLLLIGIPYYFGALPTGRGRGWLYPETLVDDRCSMFQERCSSSLEEFAVRDYGVRFAFHYELSWVVWLTMRISNESALAFHKILFGTSCATLLSHALFKNFLLFDPQFYSNFVLCHLLAIAVSFWVITAFPRAELDSMKWSIPGNAVFLGAVRPCVIVYPYVDPVNLTFSLSHTTKQQCRLSICMLPWPPFRQSWNMGMASKSTTHNKLRRLSACALLWAPFTL